MHPIAERLLDAHVAFVLDRLSPGALAESVPERIEGLLAEIGDLPLRELVRMRDVQAVAVKYASEVRYGGAIPVLVGEIARRLYEHPLHDETRLGDLMPEGQFEAFLDLLLEPSPLRDAAVSRLVANPLYAELLSELIVGALRDYLATSSRIAERVPGARSALRLGRRMVEKARPDLGGELEQGLRQFARRTVDDRLKATERFVRSALESGRLRALAMQWWDGARDMTIGELQRLVGPLDIEEGFVTGYEYWLRLRRTRYYRELIRAGVAAFFEVWGQRTVREALEDLGIDADMIAEDVLRFAPPLFRRLDKAGVLERLVRRELAPFYESGAVRAILDGDACPD